LSLNEIERAQILNSQDMIRMGVGKDNRIHPA
jgi:hypothetical protein